jgi:predicted amidophosphoribosyltransferase
MVCWNATNEETTSSMQTITTTETTGTTGTTKTAHTPVIKLTQIERAQKSCEHEFGICSSCDAGLDSHDDFVSSIVANDMKVRCNACYHYYAEEESFQKFIGLLHYDQWTI